MNRAVCFRCYFHVAAPQPVAKGARCPRCAFTLIVTAGPLEVSQEQVEGMFQRLTLAKARKAEIEQRAARRVRPVTSTTSSSQKAGTTRRIAAVR
jgi:hypothetical protein